jgi:hypothetical protein
MKKNDWILVLAVAAYTYLFYRELPGLNLFLFSSLLIGLSVYKNPAFAKSSAWKASTLGSVISGFFVMWYGNPISVIANIVSLSAMASFSLTAGSSLIMAGLNAVYSFIASVFFMVIDYTRRKKESSKLKSPLYTRFLVIVIPLLVTLIFFALYRSANPVFYNLTEEINFDFINAQLVAFIFLGIIWLYGVFFPKAVPILTHMDINAPDELSQTNLAGHEQTIIGKLISIDNELLSGIILLSLLNLLLLFLNIIDFGFLSGGVNLPLGMTYSDYVHEGTASILFSVISAILIILFYFRGHLNFDPRNKALKILTYTWIGQNLFMVFSTALKNQIYIQEYSLTGLRIGVYIFLLLTAIGLIITFLKVYGLRTNMFLIRKTAWAFYTVLILSVSINWTMLITEYNIKHSKDLDTDYLIDLNYFNIPTLMDIFPADQRPKKLNEKIEDFVWEYENTGWQSWCYNKNKVYLEIKLRTKN